MEFCPFCFTNIAIRTVLASHIKMTDNPRCRDVVFFHKPLNQWNCCLNGLFRWDNPTSAISCATKLYTYGVGVLTLSMQACAFIAFNHLGSSILKSTAAMPCCLIKRDALPYFLVAKQMSGCLSVSALKVLAIILC